MSRQKKQRETIPERLIADVCSRLANNLRVRRTLPGGGRLHIDRRLPFLCVYRKPTGQQDEGTGQLVKGEASFLIAPNTPFIRRDVETLLCRLIETLQPCFGGFLLVEIWAEPPHQTNDMASELIPAFTIVSGRTTKLPKTIAALQRGLQRIRVMKRQASTAVEYRTTVGPPGMPRLLPAARAQQLGCDLLGIEVRPVFRELSSGEVYPAVLRTLRRGMARSLKQAFFTFVRAHTSIRPTHYHSLGRRAMVKAVWEVDQRLAELSDSFDFLLQVTPVNAEAAWREFRRNHFEQSPTFHYRPWAAEPANLKRRLYQIPIDKIEDPTLAHLFREKQDELDRKITMLCDVATPRFLYGSLQVYGSVEPALLGLAKELLARLKARKSRRTTSEIGAADFAQRAADEVAHYRQQYPDFQAEVVIRDDIFSGLLVSGGRLLIGRQIRIPTERVDAMLQHEIGTHLVTLYNGRAQPFRQLASGLAGYDSLQEGLAVLSEYLVGGLNVPRRRLLAARVLAVESLIDGATFIDTFRLLSVTHRFPQRIAYTITLRAHRGGGLTKDSLYLRGLVEILDYLRLGGEIEPLLVGKLAAEHVGVIRELQLRQVLRPPPLHPRYLKDPQVRDTVQRLRQVSSALELLEERS